MRNVQIELIRLEVKYCENLAVCGVAEEEIRGFTVPTCRSQVLSGDTRNYDRRGR